MRVIHYYLVFAHTFIFNGYTYYEDAPYHFTAVCNPNTRISDVSIISTDYGMRFSNVYFELKSPPTVLSTEEIDC